jgi:hypothetical protein
MADEEGDCKASKLKKHGAVCRVLKFRMKETSLK